MQTKSIVIAFTGLLVGCGAGATVAASWAAPPVGKWQCYGVNELPEMGEAAAEGSASEYARGLNLAAPQSPVGTVLVMSGSSSPNSYNYLCSKN